MPLLLALALSSVLAAPQGLSAAAASAGRPAECRSGSGRSVAHGPTVWARARHPTLEKYCDLMARAHAQVGLRPEVAKKAAEEADAALPGHAAPHVLEARALLELGQADAALKAFDAARAIDPRSAEDPAAMHAYARALLRAGKRDEALAAYRALVPRADFLGGASERAVLLLEAADLSMLVAAGKGRGFDEALAYLREARQRTTTELAADVVLALALAFDRAGDRTLADATLLDAERAGARPHARALGYLAAPDEVIALEALSLEGTDRAAAQKKWEAYLAGAGGKGPFAAAARARLGGSKRGAPPRPVRTR